MTMTQREAQKIHDQLGTLLEENRQLQAKAAAKTTGSGITQLREEGAPAVGSTATEAKLKEAFKQMGMSDAEVDVAMRGRP